MTELEKRLQRFAKDDFREAAYDLLNYWQIKYIPLEMDRADIEDFFTQRFISSHKTFVDKIERIDWFAAATPDTFSDSITQANLEEYQQKVHYGNMAFYTVEIRAQMNRTEISFLTRSINKYNQYYPVVLLFKYYDANEGKTKLTLSMCERTEGVKTKKGVEQDFVNVGRVTILRDIDCTKVHQGHQRILNKLSVACDSFDELYSKWLEFFSNELLTKDFYNDLYKWYQWAIEPTTGVTFPHIVGDSADDQVESSTCIIRLITRLLFVWFIKQKGLVPDCLFEENDLRGILSCFQPTSATDGNYYNAILQNLFFATLNNQIEKRAFVDKGGENNPHEGVKTLFRDNDKDSWFSISHDSVLQLFRRIPFMNCGLFECLDKYANTDIDTEIDNFIDGFSCSSETLDGHFKYRAFVPNLLFFAKEHEEVVTIKKDNGAIERETIKVAGLFHIFNKYQFTVEENTPNEIVVSLDPELLGQVFENLLAAYDPATRTTARKATGSFYTPRKIVEHMVNESLVEYLDSRVDKLKDDVWRRIIGYEDVPFELSDADRRKVLETILDCKVLDPACGSGAFPMGMLHQMVHIVRKIDPTNEIWRELVLERTEDEIKKLLSERISTPEDKDIQNRVAEVMNAFDKSVDFPDYTRKLYIIQNCIYGSDIQPIAMLISKLRFFISLICEQDTRNLDFSDVEHNYGIDTLPNLETKFVAADSLAYAKVRDFEDDEWTIDKNLVKLKNELLEIRQSHFMANTQEKKLIKRADDERKRREIHTYILNQNIKPDEEKIAAWEARVKQLELDRKLVEAEDFQDVTVTIQANLFEEAQTKTINIDINRDARNRIDSQINTLKREIKKEKNKANKSDFISAVQQITSWNPYDQINPAPFFDPGWMFNVNNGFDIVIGNPPYFQTKKGKYSPVHYPYSEGRDPGKQNMYKLFVEHSYNNAKQDGIACMIVQSSLLCDMSSKHTRELLLTCTELKQIIEFPKIAPTKEGQVFASVCQGTCIYLFKKRMPNNHSFILSVNNDCTTLDHMLKVTLSQDDPFNLYPENYAIPLLRPNEFSILKKIMEHSQMMRDYVQSFAKGDMNLGTYASKICKSNSGILLMRGNSIYAFHADYSVQEYVTKGFRTDYVKKNEKTSFLLWRDISGTVDPRRLICAVSDTTQRVLYGDTVNKIELKDSTLLPYFEALLNSKLLDWVFRKTSTNNHVACSEVILLPVIVPKEVQSINSLVAKRKVAVIDSADTSNFDKALDDLIYDVYDLNSEERALINLYY